MPCAREAIFVAVGVKGTTCNLNSFLKVGSDGCLRHIKLVETVGSHFVIKIFVT